MSTATRRQMNWSAVGITPQAGTALVYSGVTNVEYTPDANVARFSGDGDRYVTTKVVDMQDPKFVVTCADVVAAMSLAISTRGTFTATHNDAKNGSGTGAIVYTMVNALIADRSVGGAHRQWGSATITFESESIDGQTNPVTTSAA